jgi:hypothetical protein
MVTYQADCPSRMCDGSLDEGARMVDNSSMYLRNQGRYRDPPYVYACLLSSHTHADTHIDSTSGLMWRTVLRPHTSASSVLPYPLPTRMSLHHLTPSHIPHIPSLLLDVQRLSSVL